MFLYRAYTGRIHSADMDASALDATTTDQQEHSPMIKTTDRPRARRVRWLLAAGVMAVTAACGGGGDKDDDAAATSGASATTASGTDGGASQLDIDPCRLLTIPEMEAAIGSGVEQGGFGEDQPGRCTYSIGGDVGAGSVGVTVGDPLTCDALNRALDAADDSAGVEVIDVGEGGIVQPDASTVSFSIGGGCINIVAGNSGRPIERNALVDLAEAAAGRVG